MSDKVQIFVNKISNQQKDKILSIYILGSRVGENDLGISDIDLLIICKRSEDIGSVFQTCIEEELNIFEIVPNKFNQFIQRFFLGSNSYRGIHLVILGRDEFDASFSPKSLRLKVLSKIIGINLLLNEIKSSSQLQFGVDLADKFKVQTPSNWEKITCFIFPIFVLIFSFPLYFIDKRSFKIWCFKAIKYHHVSLTSFLELSSQKHIFDDTLFEVAKKYRYNPDKYLENSLNLYFRSYANIIKNIPFIFST
jgi:predicted nucleotidyltransferase